MHCEGKFDNEVSKHVHNQVCANRSSVRGIGVRTFLFTLLVFI